MAEINEIVYNLLEKLLAGTDVYLVNIKVTPVNNIKVYLDSDSGFTIEKCISINRSLYPLLEQSAFLNDKDFSLEVSSPGVDEPLMLLRQYKKNIGRKLLVTLKDNTEKTGVLKDVDDEQILLEVKPPKQKNVLISEIPFDSIKKAIVQISFN